MKQEEDNFIEQSLQPKPKLDLKSLAKTQEIHKEGDWTKKEREGLMEAVKEGFEYYPSDL